MKHICISCTFPVLVMVVGILVMPTTAMPGPSSSSAVAAGTDRAQLEQEFRAIPDPGRMREYMKILSSHPHHVGSAQDRENADWILARFKAWGFDAHLETFDVLFPTPKERLVELVAPTKFTAQLREPVIPEDPTSSQQSEQLPTYNAYSADGDVTAPLVYVNYGIPDDYTELERMGISVKGTIVIARYGASWRGIKPKVAAEHGAVGCLIYSDPGGDGYYQGDTYPGGAWRPGEGVQRGSVEDMPLYPGDPLTPGVAATEHAKRLPLKDVKVFTKIPVLPLSYDDAKPLLATLGGPVAPASWRGALPLTYHVGPGPAEVHLKVASHWDLKPIHDVIATIHGTGHAGQWVIRGNHQDAWVNGAEDPISGLVAELEEARALGVLLARGWKPDRTIVYCAWDGEEPGLLGSTEWAEAHADELRQHAAVYINSDSNDRGYLGAGGSHSLQRFINDVARSVQDPETSMSVWKRLQLRRISDAESAQDRGDLRRSMDLKIGALGSGSDYTAFIDHLGIASLNLGFGGEGGGGVYHSVYDDFYWYTHYSDTSFVYGRALAQTAGTAVLRFADDDILPYDFSSLAATVRRYVEDLESLLKKMRDEAMERNTEIDEGVFKAIADPWMTMIPPGRLEVPPHINFAPLQNAVDTLESSAKAYASALEDFRKTGRPAPSVLDDTLIQAERRLTSDAGLPGRPWFKHVIYAPGLYTGYGVKTIPGVREAIEQKRWGEAGEQIAIVADVLSREADLVAGAARILRNASR